jgi:uncharacterized protein (TIGR02246 family)
VEYSPDERAVRALYQRLLDGWNARDGAAYAAPFSEEATVVGFDGSEMVGRAAIGATLSAIFADHPTPEYIAIVRSVAFPVPDTAILRADSGLLPRGATDLNPALYARHALVAVRRDGAWAIAHFQNTPAALHGRADLADALTAELRGELARQRPQSGGAA